MSRVSIVIPVHGQAALTRRCLEALLPDLPPGCEVLVVDDASGDETPALLREFDDRIRTLSLAENVGFARACNAGAEAAAGELLIFLNNDTEPRAGWLDALLRCADGQPQAEIVGAKLIYPNGTVQHAGVVFGQDGYPHNLYAGLPENHPAVERSRRLQAVTAACMLVRRAAFEQAGGFDAGYENSLEDVDLCLRIGVAGGEVHYCHEAVVTHLESASRGRRDRFARSVELYRRRWRESVRRDDLSIYAEDGLLEVEYPASYPLRFSISPRLAAIGDGREAEIEKLLAAYSGQVSDLLAEVMRLSALAGVTPQVSAEPTARPVSDYGALLAEASRLEVEARLLQERLGVPTEGLGYRRLVEEVRAAVQQHVPAGKWALVVSRGDRELVDLGAVEGGHFPQDAEGRYRGHHPEDGEDALAQLEELRCRGADYLVIPTTSYWWLDHYGAFGEHLRACCDVTELGSCKIYELAPAPEAAVREKVG